MSVNSNTTAIEDYNKAYRLGKKEGVPLPCLDDILKAKNITSTREVPLGLVQIPTELLVGTKSAGRSNAFSKSFYPLLKENTEFAAKWITLDKAHLNEGIREPVKAYEFMNKFYVEEGNKRVSVLKFYEAVSIPGFVTRLLPPRTDDKETRIYYEFMEFYNLSAINYIWFSQEGSFAKLQQLVGKCPDEIWSDDDKINFNSTFTRFTAEYENIGGNKLPITPGDAFLTFLELYDYDTLSTMTAAEMKQKVQKTWNEFKLLTTDESLELQMDPVPKKKPLLSRLISTSDPMPRVAFIHEKTAHTSGWTYAHDLGRMHVEQVLGDQVYTTSYENATKENAEALINKAIEEGNNLIFTTSPPLLKASLKAAIEHPEVKILNCSLNTSYRSVRTYYARMYEAKFLMGAIGGAMARNGKVGYIADYPIYGMTANINAFALGAKMVNPHAKVYLEWSTLKNQEALANLKANDVHYISGQDMSIPDEPSRHFGLYHADEQCPINLAMPIWNWGIFYETMIKNILNGSFKYDDTTDDTKGLNYWWGMSTGLIDVICSRHLPIGTTRLVDLLKETICRGDFNPFSGILYSQTGVVQKDADKIMSPEEIITMDWLAENVVGYIPKMDDLIEHAKPVVSLQGIDKPENAKL